MIGSYRFNYVAYGNLEIMYVLTGMWSTVFGVVTGIIGIKASNQPIFKLKKINHLHRSFTPIVSLDFGVLCAASSIPYTDWKAKK